MKVILYMVITVNGYIAKQDDDTSWVSETEWKDFSGLIRKYGNMIIGRRTYEIMLKEDTFNSAELNEVKTVVLTSDSSLAVHNPDNVSLARSPKEAIKAMEDQGFATIMVCGGGGLNSSFMKENLVDEIYLDVEPIVFGRGIRLFAEADFEVKLKLLGVKRFSANEIRLHYRVIK